MKFDQIRLKSVKFLFFGLLIGIAGYMAACQSSTTNPYYQTDEQYLKSITTAGYNSDSTQEDNLMIYENGDLNDGGAYGDNGNGPMYNPIDSLKRWGRIVDNVNINLNGTFSGDTMYTLIVTKTITGHFRIIGYHNGGQTDSVDKPYSETLMRVVSFKRLFRYPNPALNWRVYQVSCLTGNTTTPQNGNSNTQLLALVIFKNGVLVDTLHGPDFTTTKFTTRKFGGDGIPKVNIGDQITIYAIVNSTEQNNYVAWHWRRNAFGFHRIPFTFLNSTPGGNGFIVTFTKTFMLYSNHPLGVFNGYINASTHESLWDDDLNLFSSTEVGIPYRVGP